MRKLLQALAFLVMPAFASAQQRALLAIDYDLDATSATTTCFTGDNDSVWGAPVSGTGRIETSGSSTTVTGVTAAADSFAPIAVGDVIFIRIEDTTHYRLVTAKASADSITVNSAINLDVTGGWAWRWLNFTSGTGAETCWVPIDTNYRYHAFTFELNQYTGDGNGLDYRFECRAGNPASSPTKIFPESNSFENVTAAGIATNKTVVLEGGIFQACRYLALHNTADDGTDTGGDAEKVTVTVERYN